MTSITKACPLLAILGIALAPACDSSDHVIGRGPLSKADQTGSCQASDGGDLCGGQSDGTCYCDDACESFADCCADKASVCDGGELTCEEEHEPCQQGQPDCWGFGDPEGLSFSGFFVPECDELDQACPDGSECQFNPACGLDDLCPGLCASSQCTAAGTATCAADDHVQCVDFLDTQWCWFFGADEGLPFEGYFSPECNDADQSCPDGQTCVLSPCPFDAPCPGLCEEPVCVAE